MISCSLAEQNSLSIAKAQEGNMWASGPHILPYGMRCAPHRIGSVCTQDRGPGKPLGLMDYQS
jgi:hypothetical protein